VSYETSVNQYQGNEIENDQLYEIIGNEVWMKWVCRRGQNDEEICWWLAYGIEICGITVGGFLRVALLICLAEYLGGDDSKLRN
jgi:hypothetical protein